MFLYLYAVGYSHFYGNRCVLTSCFMFQVALWWGEVQTRRPILQSNW